MYRILMTDNAFRELNLPILPALRREMENQIRKYGPDKTIPVWRGYILMEYDQYEICTKLHRDYRWKELDFPRKSYAMIWICRQQLEQDDIIWQAKAWLISHLYEIRREEERKLDARTRFQYKQLSPSSRQENIQVNTHENTEILEELGKAYNCSRDTIRRYVKYGREMDRLEEMVPGSRSKILTGQLRVTLQHMALIMKTPPEQLKKIMETPGIRELIPPSEIIAEGKEKPARRKKKEFSLKTGIKQMPIYDPDAELNSLTYTVNAWTKALARTNEKKDIGHARKDVMDGLHYALSKLKAEINCLADRLEDNTHV